MTDPSPAPPIDAGRAVRAPLLADLIARTDGLPPIRVAVANAAQATVMDTLREAKGRGMVEPLLIGEREALRGAASGIGWNLDGLRIVEVATDAEAAAASVRMVRAGEADALMKGMIHTDLLMHAVLDAANGLRVAGRRVSHAFVCDIPSLPRLLVISDGAVNIAPDLAAKADILRNAIELCHLLGSELPKAAILSAIETVNPAIISTLDAAALAVMARRGQIAGAIVDGPLAFDNAISAEAAREKGIDSPVAGAADILLVPDLVTGNVLAKNLEYLAGATAAGLVLGLSAPLILTSRADPPSARLASLALAVLVHATKPRAGAAVSPMPEANLICAPQPDYACRPMSPASPRLGDERRLMERRKSPDSS